ncbi:PREDICTED: serine-rich adhesin for platelets-like [Cyprinodon variegatus]|uniref:serine-rich adhesin for platelets-like n=1 Tax=Cyprinodon variegatus TaxID=28743 RepID=UPI0007426968|nr:PREDICTED: serine-rich adhesin for platelets-like [Cyprinodon variegatus]
MGSGTAGRLKAGMGTTALLSNMGTSAQPPAFHRPWNKARVGPMEDGRKAEVIHLGNGRAVQLENKRGRNDEAKESRGEKEHRAELGILGRENRNGIAKNLMRNAAVQGGGNRAEHRGRLPGWVSSGWSVSLDGDLVIDRSYFQTSTEARTPAPAKQKPNEALSLISLARRLQGPTRVDDKHWSDRRGSSRKMYGSIGDMSVSAAVSTRGRMDRRWEGGDESRDSMTEQSDSETGSSSRDSPSEFSLSERSSQTSSAAAETEINESDSETERGDESQKEEKVDSNSNEESGSESEYERAEPSRKRSKGHRYVSKRSKNLSGSTDPLNSSYPSFTAQGLQTSRNTHSWKTSRQDSEELSEEEEEEEGSFRVKKSSVSRRGSGHNKIIISSGVMGASDDLSTIMEDTEEEEKSRSQSRGRRREEEVTGNESAV